MTARTRWSAALWTALGLLASTAAASMAQGSGGTLPAYGEPAIISNPGLRQVFTADFTSDGLPDFATVNAATVTVYPGMGDGTFGAGMTSNGCATWNQAFLGDFNGDGTPDIAFREYPDVIGGSDPAGVMFGTGTGTFQPYRRVGALPYETTAAAGDFDGDGRTDLAGVGNWGGSLTDPTAPVYAGIVILWGRTDGNVDRSGVELNIGSVRVGHRLFTADVSGDGTPDLMWSQSSLGRFVVMPGLGGRSFGAPIDHTSAGEPTRFAAADFNADGMRDLAVLYSGGIGILNGNGDGTFQPVTALGPWDHGGVTGTSSLLAWDFNGDTKPDLSIDAAEGVALFVNNGNGSFLRGALTAGVIEPHSNYSPLDYGSADFNRDGRPDFVVAWADSKAGIYLGLAATTALAASSPSSIVGQPVTLTATVTPSHLTGPVTFYDGLHVLGSALLTGGQAALTTTMLAPGAHALRAAYGGTLMGAQSTLSPPVSHPVTALPSRSYLTSFDMTFSFYDLMPHGLGVADLNRDGAIDLVAADYWWNYTFGFFAGRGDGTLESAVINPRAGVQVIRPRWVILGDVNRDGNPDVCIHGDRTTLSLGNGDGTFQAASNFSDAAQTQLADVNGDGTLDQVFTYFGRLTVTPGTGNRRGTFVSYPIFDLVVASHQSEIALGDFNGDLKLDIAMTTAQENRLYVLLGNGDGTFGAPRTSDRGNGPTSPVVADFNSDGKPDLAFANAGSGKISILPGKGDGDFLTAIDTTVGGTLTRMTTADLTGDGKVDLAVISTSEDRVLVLPGNGNGTFGSPRKLYAGTVPMDVVAADFNGDGRLDLAVSSNADIGRTGPGRISVLLGVDPAQTSVALSATPTATTLSDPVTMTATVSPSVATGWVTFNDGATPLGSVPVIGGQATFQTRLLGSGVHLLAAVFSGDGSLHGASASSPVTVRVAAADAAELAPSAVISPSMATLAAPADFNGDGIVDLIVCGTDGATVLLGVGSGEFTPGASFYGCERASHLLAADFNRDGKTDLAAGPTVSFGNGDGTFGTPRALQETGAFVVAADFNGDGAVDLLDASGKAFLNRGAGTFMSPAHVSPALSLTWFYAVAGDLNADGRADLVVPNGATGEVYVLLAAADGSFAVAVPSPTVANPVAVAIADFNGDGIPDLAVGGSTANARVGVMLGLGNGTFENWGDALTGLAALKQLLLCDFDGDGNLDLLASNSPAQPVKWLRGLGDGTFASAVDYAAIPEAYTLLLVDLNHDGRTDFVHASSGLGARVSASVAVAESAVSLMATPALSGLSEDVTLTAAVTPAAATGTITFYDGAVILGKAAVSGGQATLTTKWLSVGRHTLRAHYGGDRLRYAASLSSDLSLAVEAGASAGVGAATTFATGRGPRGITAGDLNGDGRQDLVVANATSNTVSVFLGNGTGGFAPRVNYNTGSAPVAVALADLDADGAVDVVVANAGSSNVSILRGNGNGTLQTALNVSVGTPSSVLDADVNFDQATEVVVGTTGGAVAIVNPTGTASTAGVGAGSVAGFDVVDVNGDGWADVVMTTTTGHVLAHLRDANGLITTKSTYTFYYLLGMAAGDFNGDGRLDVATLDADDWSEGAMVLLGNADGTFQPAAFYAVGTGPTAIAATDVDGDGLLDLVVANGGSNTLTLLLGQGDGTFVAGNPLATGTSPAGVVAGDFNGDGVVDLAVTNAGSDSLSVFLGQAAPPSGGPASDFTGDQKSDILWRHATGGDVWLWPMDGAAHRAESYVGLVGEAGWEIQGVGDQTGDGQADLLWRHAATGLLYLWTMNGSAVEAETYVGTVEPAYDIVGTGDYNGDGKSDILWRHVGNGELWVWLMDGVTTLGVHYVDTVDPAYEVQGSGDLNGDGKADLVWQHATQGDVWAWLMNGPTPVQVAYVSTVSELAYRIVGVADYTGDGKADLLWHHATRGEVWLWPMDGTTQVSQAYVDTVPDTGYRIVGTGDYNGDGQADILWHHDTRGEVWVWLMDGAVKLSETYVATVPEVQYRIVR